MDIFSRRTLGWLLLFNLAGCGGQLHQYVDIQSHPVQAADQIASRAYEKGYEIGPMRTDPRLGFDLYQIRWLGEEEQQADAAAPPAGNQASELVEGVDFERFQVAEVEFYPTDTGNRLAVRTDYLTSDGLAELLPGEPTLSYQTTTSANPITETFSWELVSNVGWRWSRAARTDMHALDLDASARFGGRLLRFGGGGDTPAGSYALGLMAGVGLGLGSGGFEFRPSVFISLDHQETVSPVPDEVLAVGQKLSVDLGVQAMIGSEVRGLTGRLEIRFAEYAGLYLAAGYQFAPEASPVVTIGLSLGTMPVAGVGLLYLFAL